MRIADHQVVRSEILTAPPTGSYALSVAATKISEGVCPAPANDRLTERCDGYGCKERPILVPLWAGG